MKLVENDRAPNPRRVRIFLAEKGIKVERENVDIMNLEHKQPDRLKDNPMARLPYLVLDDGTIIAETMAICRYFDAVQPEPCLFGDSAVERGCVEMWQRRAELNLLLPVAFVFRHSHPRMADLETPQVLEWSKANEPKVMEMLDFLNSELETRRFIAGDRYTVADITCLCAIDFMRVARIAMDDHHTGLKRWHEEVSARPSAAA